MDPIKPTTTAIIPAYKAASYLGAAVNSVLAQTVPCKAIIIVDASPDETGRVADELAAANPEQVRVVHNEQNLGVSASRNLGVELADTPYVAFLDADDWWESTKIERQLALMNDADLCYTGRQLMNPDGSFTGKTISVPASVTYERLLMGNVVPCSSTLMPRQLALKYPQSHDELHEDYIMWLCMLRDGCTFVGLDEPLLKSRMAERGKSRNKLKSAQMTFGVYRHMGIPVHKALGYFVSYALQGIKKYI